MKILFALIVLTVTVAASATPNVALGKSVSLVGNFGTLRPGSIFNPQPLASASTLTDGVYVSEGTPWQSGTIWWDTQVPGAADDYVFVDLGGLFQIDSVRLQSDDNDEMTSGRGTQRGLRSTWATTEPPTKARECERAASPPWAPSSRRASS